jgi:hypothetical protein
MGSTVLRFSLFVGRNIFILLDKIVNPIFLEDNHKHQSAGTAAIDSFWATRFINSISFHVVKKTTKHENASRKAGGASLSRYAG